MCPLTVLPATVAMVPRLTWMPFWAMTAVGPTPVTVLPWMLAVEPALSTPMPSFW